jgi:hypothetical protein
VWAGVDNFREQEKLEARKILEKAADSHLSSAPREDANVLFPERNWGATGVYCEWQTYRPYKAMATGLMPSRGAPWSPINMIHPVVAQQATPFRKL